MSTIPLGMLVAITGVSGSGKSTLVHDVLYNALCRRRGQERRREARSLYRELRGRRVAQRGSAGRSVADRAHAALQSRSPTSRRSTPFASCSRRCPRAQKRGYAAGHFSFNIPGGRCEACQGDGTVTVEMQFLADVELPCEECKGTRYKPEVLEVRYHGKNIHDVLS